MGSYVSAHITEGKADITRLLELPESTGYRVYYSGSADLSLIDTFRVTGSKRYRSSPEGSCYPFASDLPADIATDFPDSLEMLKKVYDALFKLGYANSFSRKHMNFCLTLNSLLAVPVLSFVSDDEDLDFACTASGGALTRLKCQSQDLRIRYENGKLSIDPLIVELFDRPEEEVLTDTAMLKERLPGIQIGERNMPHDSSLHATSIEEWNAFTGGQDELIVGLGAEIGENWPEDFDPRKNAMPPGLELIGQSIRA